MHPVIRICIAKMRVAEYMFSQVPIELSIYQKTSDSAREIVYP